MTLGIISRWTMRMTLSVISLGWGTRSRVSMAEIRWAGAQVVTTLSEAD